MIAKAGRLRLLNGERAELDTDVRSRHPIDDLEPVSESSVCRAERRSA
jgi:hypothetical protein